MAGGDHVDRLIDQWRTVHPDMELEAMAVFGRLGRLFAHASRSIEDVLGQHGLTIGEFDVLAALRRTGPPNEMTPTALARLLMLSPAGMTNRIDRLEGAGLVERRADPSDRRSFNVALTSSGRRLVDEALEDHLRNEQQLLSGLTKMERRSLDAILRKLLVQFEGD